MKTTQHPPAAKPTELQTRGGGGCKDGFGFIEQSRAAGYAGKFLVYAASITQDARLRLRELRVERIIEKPVRGGGLIDAVREIESGS